MPGRPGLRACMPHPAWAAPVLSPHPAPPAACLPRAQSAARAGPRLPTAACCCCLLPHHRHRCSSAPDLQAGEPGGAGQVPQRPPAGACSIRRGQDGRGPGCARQQRGPRLPARLSQPAGLSAPNQAGVACATQCPRLMRASASAPNTHNLHHHVCRCHSRRQPPPMHAFVNSGVTGVHTIELLAPCTPAVLSIQKCNPHEQHHTTAVLSRPGRGFTAVQRSRASCSRCAPRPPCPPTPQVVPSRLPMPCDINGIAHCRPRGRQALQMQGCPCGQGVVLQPCGGCTKSSKLCHAVKQEQPSVRPPK